MRRSLSSLILLRSIPRKYPSHTHRVLISANKNQLHILNYYSLPTSDTYFGSSNYQNRASYYSTQSPGNKANGGNQLKVEIIGKEFIKPATPTPQHLRTLEFSLIDLLYPNIYTANIVFYPNNDKNDDVDQTLKLLKRSLSKTLTRFYPLAGRISKDNSRIDCNDDGVYYVEAKFNACLSDFLTNNHTITNNKSVHPLLPFYPDLVKLSSMNVLSMVQVNTFTCGGIAIGLYTSHKFHDGTSVFMFFNAWAATAHGAHEEIRPHFIGSSIFPSSPALLDGNTTGKIIPYFPQGIKTVTQRFVFPASSLATLKEKTGSSRALSLAGLLTKCLARSCNKKSNYTSVSLSIAVNLRNKINTPPNSFGNIFLTSPPVLCPTTTITNSDDDQEYLGLDSIVQSLKDSANQVNGDVVNGMKDEAILKESMKQLTTFYSDNNVKHFFVSSACNMGMYEADFGWGRPIWVNLGLSDIDIPLTENNAVFMDTRSGNGIEAWVNLPEQDMVHFERDPLLVSLASINPSPLHKPMFE